MLDRGPLRGAARRLRTPQLSPRELAEKAKIPEQFLEVTALYLETYATRVSGKYSTLRGKAIALGYFFIYLDEVHHLSGPEEVPDPVQRLLRTLGAKGSEAVRRVRRRGS